jgi:hypothetical protein
LNESIQFDTYLVSIVSQANKTYDILAGFTWTDTFEMIGADTAPRMHVTNLAAISTTLPQAYQDIAFNYANMGWTLVPEPSSLSILGCAAVLGLGFWLTRRRRIAA